MKLKNFTTYICFSLLYVPFSQLASPYILAPFNYYMKMTVTLKKKGKALPAQSEFDFMQNPVQL